MTRQCYGRDCVNESSPASGKLHLCAACWQEHESTGRREWYLQSQNRRLQAEVRQLQSQVATLQAQLLADVLGVAG